MAHVKPRISLCMIVKDEEKYLGRCLASIAPVVDEIIVVDTGSVDRSADIAKEYGTRLYNYPWANDFAAARNFSLEQATGDWIFYLDGDEELKPGCAEALGKLVEDDTVDGYFLKTINFYEEGGGLESSPDLVFRLFRNCRDYRFEGVIHEQVADRILAVKPGAKFLIAENVELLHYGYLNENIQAKDKKERNLNLLSQRIRKNPAHRLDRYHLGVEYFRLQNYPKALENFLLAWQGVNLGLLYSPKLIRYIVLCYMLGLDYDQALKYIDLGLEAYPQYVDLLYYKGVILFERKDFKVAYQAFVQCQESKEIPVHYASHGGMSTYKPRYHQGLILELCYDYEGALAIYIELLRTNPGFSQPRARIVKILKPREYPEDAEQSLHRVFQLDSPETYLCLAEHFFEERALNLAWKYLEKAGANPANQGLTLLRGVTLQRLNQHFLALKELKQIPPESGFYITAQSNIFLSHWLQNSTAKARGCLRVLAGRPEAKELSEILKALLNKKPSKSRVDGVASPEQEKKYLNVFTELLDRLLELDRRDELQRIMEIMPSFMTERPCLALGKIYAKYNYPEEAIKELRYALEQQPSNCAEINLWLGKLSSQLKEYAQGEQYLQAALSEDPKNPEIYLELTQVFLLMAREILLEGSARFPQGELFNQALQQTEAQLAVLGYEIPGAHHE